MRVTLYGVKKRMQGTLGNPCFECEHADVVTDENLTESLIVSQEGMRLDVEWTNRADGNHSNSIFKNPKVEVPDTDRKVIIMVTIYDWFCAKWDASTETWQGVGRHEGLVYSRCYPHLWMEMQEEFKVKRKENL